MKSVVHQYGTILKKSFNLLSEHNPLLLSGATAFFTIFALSPILILLANLLSLFFNENEILPKLYAKIASATGDKSATDIKKIVENFLSLETSWWIKMFITIFFYFVATTLLSVIRQAIQQLWDIEKKPAKKKSYHFKERLIEIAMILFIGVLFLVSTLIDDGLSLMKHTLAHLSGVGNLIAAMANATLSVLITATWFTMVFKFLPEARVQWKVGIAGGLLTGIMFNIGKFILTKIFVQGSISSIFGPSSSIAILLLFIFYCSFILYFGAAFTVTYAKSIGKPIHPGKYGIEVKEEVVEAGN